MTRGDLALTVACLGAVAFLAGLYGFGNQFASGLAVLGLCALLFGIFLIALSARNTTLTRPHSSVIVISILGVLLHLYEQIVKSTEPSLGSLAWASLPYGVCLVASTVHSMRLPSSASAIVAFMFDLWAHYSVFIAPQGSTAALLLIFAPIWSSLVIVPVTMLVVRSVFRHRGTGFPMSPNPSVNRTASKRRFACLQVRSGLRPPPAGYLER